MNIATTPGSWVLWQHWVPSGWAKVFALLGPEFPSPSSQQKEWAHFLVDCAVWPSAVIVAGVLVTFIVLLQVCCSSPSRHMLPNRPKRTPVMIIAMLSFTLILVGSMIYWARASSGTQGLNGVLASLHADVVNCVAQVDVLEMTSKDVINNLDQLSTACPSISGQLQNSRDEAMLYRDKIIALDVSLKPIPQDSQKLLNLVSLWIHFIQIVLLAPLCLVLFIVVVITLLVFCSNDGTCTGPTMPCGSLLLFAPAVWWISVTSASQLWAGIATGSFCTNADAHELAYTKHFFGASSIEYELSQYYLDGGTTNPLLQQLEEAQVILNKQHTELESAAPLITMHCGDQAKKMVDGLKGDLKRASSTISLASNLLSRDHIQPYYQAVLPEGLCSKIIEGLGWLATFQIITAIMCLPCLAVVARMYLDRRAEYIMTFNSRFWDGRPSYREQIELTS